MGEPGEGSRSPPIQVRNRGCGKALTEESVFKPHGELVKEIGKLRGENKELHDYLKQKRIVLEKYETELRRY